MTVVVSCDHSVAPFNSREGGEFLGYLTCHEGVECFTQTLKSQEVNGWMGGWTSENSSSIMSIHCLCRRNWVDVIIYVLLCCKNHD
jgi:hypothetical protein